MDNLNVKCAGMPAFTAFLLMLFLVSTGGTVAQASGIGTVTEVQGHADVIRNAAPPVRLSIGDQVHRADTIRTRTRSFVEITMTDGSRLSIGQSTELHVEQYAVGSQPHGLLHVIRGRMRSLVSSVFSKKKESFKVTTPTAVVGVQGTDFAIAATSVKTRVDVFKGVVAASNIDTSIPGKCILHPGESAEIYKGKPPVKLAAGTSMTGLKSGATQDIYSGGEQGTDPRALTPTRVQSVPLPPVPSPPTR